MGVEARFSPDLRRIKPRPVNDNPSVGSNGTESKSPKKLALVTQVLGLTVSVNPRVLVTSGGFADYVQVEDNQMAKVTGFKCLDGDGSRVPCDAFGNNVAFACPKCKHPILAVMRDRQRGASIDNPAKCAGCGLRAWMEVDAARERLILHQVAPV